jgi:hypothetical protein
MGLLKNAVPDRCPHLPSVGHMWTCAAHKNENTHSFQSEEENRPLQIAKKPPVEAASMPDKVDVFLFIELL